MQNRSDSQWRTEAEIFLSFSNTSRGSVNDLPPVQITLPKTRGLSFRDRPVWIAANGSSKWMANIDEDRQRLGCFQLKDEIRSSLLHLQ